MSWLWAVRDGLRNFWHFRRVVWRWRGWDYMYSYHVFLRALELQANTMERSHNHENTHRDVAEIREAIAAWSAFEDGPEYPPLGKMTRGEVLRIAGEERDLWVRFHDLLKRNARSWWD